MVFDGAVATSPGFAYPDSSVCKNSSNPTPTISGTPGGEFTAVAVFPASAVLVFTDGSPSSTGTVDLAASDVGAYQITYTVGGVSETDAFSIQAVQISTFSYSSSSLQQIGTASPTFAVGTTAGGTFAATSGIIFQDTGTNTGSSTGVINLGLSTIGGPYTITYTSPGPCASSSTFDVSVIAVAIQLIPNNFAMEFNGTDEYTSAPNSMSALTGLSVSAWVYPTNYGSAAAESFVSTDSISPRGFYIGVYNASNFRFAFTTNGANLTAINTNSGTVDLNVWQHILVTWDQVNLKFYKNGNLLNTVPTTFASNGTFTTTNNLLIGSRQLGNVGMFEGDIDEVAVWSKTLELEDVQRIYNATNDNPGQCGNLFTAGLGTGLVFWDRMGD